MLLKSPQFEIVPDDPFKNDVLNRKESAEILTEFMTSFEEPVVLVLNSSWGSGKTTFINMWRPYLHDQGYCTVYFNAWENDFTDNALVSLVGELKKSMDDIKFKDKGKLVRSFGKVKNASIQVLKIAIPSAVKLGTAGILDIGSVSEEILSKLTEKIAQHSIDAYEKAKNKLELFRKELTLFVSKIQKQNPIEKRPLIFFIDELDRCRPNYALEVLEKAKHLFLVPGLIFVLSIDKEQMQHTIRSIYGHNMDVDGYLRRFFDFEYVLPAPKTDSFCEYLMNLYGFDEYFKSKRNYYDLKEEGYELSKISQSFFQVFDFSLRVQEQIFSQIAIAIRTTPHNMHIFPGLLVFLLSLRAVKPGLYKLVVNKQIGFEDLFKELSKIPNFNSYMKEVDNPYSLLIEAYLFYAMRKEELGSIDLSRYNEMLSNEKSSKSSEAVRANRIIKRINYFQNNNYTMMEYLRKKIEILDRFKNT